MFDFTLGPGLIEFSITNFMSSLARLSFLVFFMPGLGEQTISLQIRVLVMIALAIAIASSGVTAAPTGLNPQQLAALIAGEVAIGFFLGATLRVSIWVLSSAGSVIAQSIGLSQFLGVALEQEAQTLTANLLALAGATLLLSVNYHVHAVAAHIRLYTELPVGSLFQLDPGYFIEIIVTAFSYALMLAWPFVAVSLLYNICLGFINRALPQLMVAFVGAPFMVGAGMVMLAISIASLLAVWMRYLSEFAQWL